MANWRIEFEEIFILVIDADFCFILAQFMLGHYFDFLLGPRLRSLASPIIIGQHGQSNFKQLPNQQEAVLDSQNTTQVYSKMPYIFPKLNISHKGWSLKFLNFVFCLALGVMLLFWWLQLIAHGKFLFLMFPKWGETSL